MPMANGRGWWSWHIINQRLDFIGYIYTLKLD